MSPAREFDQYEILKGIFGASRLIVNQRFAIYFPDTDKSKPPKKIEVDSFIGRALQMFDQINVGATALPVAAGIWKGVLENTVVVYSFIDQEKFFANIHVIRAFVHEFGRERNQDSVLIEFADAAMFVSDFEQDLAQQ